ncbi:uncharacterized protein LOC110739325 [Chenopodium quinoa]|uniref:uncharacterized protein LOC110739325 n=1 Tax=Chenopodium quinoa TaxID=63459 RepID=UPI000B779815|nr:uncharacterized protein LOC110739325 [Chenopodium quinoa]
MKLPDCTCSAAKEYANLHEVEMLHQFFLGLEPKKFGSTLLMSDPLPSMNAAYAKVVADERKQSVSEAHEASTSATIGFNATGVTLDAARNLHRDGVIYRHRTSGQDRGPKVDVYNYNLHEFPDGGRGGRGSCGGRGGRSFGKGKGEFAGAVGSSRGSNEQVSDSDRGSVPMISDAQWMEIMAVVKGSKSGSSSDGNKLGTYNSIEWLIDTGASNHMSCNIDLFTDLHDISSPVGYPNGKSTTTTKEGKVILSDGLTLYNVLYVPALKCNLLSDRSLKNLIRAGEQYDGVYIFHLVRAQNLQANKVLIREFCAMAKTQFGRKVKVVRSDNGQEFLSLRSFFAKKGFLHQTSCVNTAQQNSRGERKHRHILNVARALRFQAKLPKYFWGECVMTVVHLINKTPTPVLNGKTRHECLFGQKPSYDSLRVFGCLWYAANCPRVKDKLDSRSRKCIFFWLSEWQKRDQQHTASALPARNQAAVGQQHSTSQPAAKQPSSSVSSPHLLGGLPHRLSSDGDLVGALGSRYSSVIEQEILDENVVITPLNLRGSSSSSEEELGPGHLEKRQPSWHRHYVTNTVITENINPTTSTVVPPQSCS